MKKVISTLTAAMIAATSLVSTAASAEDNLYDGDMFTFYVSDNTSLGADKITIVNTAFEDISTTLTKAVAPMTLTGGYFKVRDIDNDGSIDVTDASFVLHAVSVNNGDKLSIADANSNLSHYFEYTPNTICAQAANPICPAHDDNNDGKVSDYELEKGLLKGHISKADADDVLVYYGLAATGKLKDYENQSTEFCGRKLYFFT